MHVRVIATLSCLACSACWDFNLEERCVTKPDLAAAAIKPEHAGIMAAPSFRLYAPSRFAADDASLPQPITLERLRAAYHLPDHGGYGTIAVIEAFDHPAVEDDLRVFSDALGLSPCTSKNGCFEKHLMRSGIASDPGWALETALDVEWLHALAPSAKILVVAAAGPYLRDLMAAVDFAGDREDVVAVSMSWGAGEFLGEEPYDPHFFGRCGMTFFASSGDGGSGASWPAASRNVTAVGGTTLAFNDDGSLASETAWSGSGGGVSPFLQAPNYQVNIGLDPLYRRYPDVSANADPLSGYPVYSSVEYLGASGWMQVGGTSAAVLVWAAIKSLGLSADNAKLYKASSGPASADLFRDITEGTNGPCGTRCAAGPGYDNVTGLGSPLSTVY